MKMSKYDYEVVLNKTKLKVFHHYARFCLNIKHVREIVNKDLEFYHKMQVGDEYFLSALYPLNNFRNFAVIHDDWEYTNKLKKKIKNQIKLLYEEQEKTNSTHNNDKIKQLQEQFKKIASHPKTINIITKNDLKKIKKVDSFFYRKFSLNSDISEYWDEIINPILH